MTTTMMARGGRGYRAVVTVVPVLSIVAVCRRKDVDGCWRGVGGVGRDVVIVARVMMWEREGGGGMATTTVRGGRGYRAVVAVMAGVLWRTAVDVPQLGVTHNKRL